MDWLLYLLTGLTLIGVGIVTVLERCRLRGVSGWVLYLTDLFGTIGLHLLHITFGVLFGLS